MPDYSVTIRLEGWTRSQVAKKLRSAFGSVVAKEAQVATAHTRFDCDAACRANNHFGCVHWTDKDLRGAFRDLKIPMTSRTVDAAKGSYSLQHISDRMVELGWEIIEEAIRSAGGTRAQH